MTDWVVRTTLSGFNPPVSSPRLRRDAQVRREPLTRKKISPHIYDRPNEESNSNDSLENVNKEENWLWPDADEGKALRPRIFWGIRGTSAVCASA
jgi:hypothetical protein